MQTSQETEQRGGEVAPVAVAEEPMLGRVGRFKKWLGSSTPDMKVGTLQYTGASLLVVFLWLFWGDIIYTLSEAVFPNSIALQLDRLAVPKMWVGILKGTAGASVSFFFVPLIGFRSDRTRTRWGRRIPYILWTLIPVTVSMAALGFTDDIAVWIRASDWPARLHMTPNTMILLVVGSMVVIFDISNVFITTVWWFLLRDVVPTHYIIRFMAAFGVVATIFNMTFNKFFAWRVETNTREIYCAGALLYLVGFLIICLKVKEGQYPPVDREKADSVFLRFAKALQLYFSRCFTHPLILMMYLWAAVGAFQAGCNPYGGQVYLTRYMNFSLKQQATYWVWQGWIILAIKYPMGASLHRFIHPMRGLFYAMLLLLPLPWLYFMMDDYQVGAWAMSAYTMWILINLWQCPLTQMHYLSLYPLQTKLFPQQEFGQLRSAEIMVTSGISIVAGLVGSAFVGELMFNKFGRYGYGVTFLWQGVFSLVGFACLCVMFWYWKLYGAENFNMDLKSTAGVTRGALWRPVKVLGAVVLMILVLAGVGTRVLLNRPDFGFETDTGKELTSAKTVAIMQEKAAGERASFEARHARNLETLKQKHLFFERDTVREKRNYDSSSTELGAVARDAQVFLAARTLEKANVSWCVAGDRAAEYWIDDTQRTWGTPAVLVVSSMEQAAKELEKVGFTTERLDGAIRLKGIYDVDLLLLADRGDGYIFRSDKKAKVGGMTMRFERLEGTYDRKVTEWHDLGRTENQRAHDLAMLNRLVEANPELVGRAAENAGEMAAKAIPVAGRK